MKEKTLAEILGDFSPVQDKHKGSIKAGGPVTIWLPAEAKAKYDRLQERSGRQFSKKARAVLLELIEIAESRSA